MRKKQEIRKKLICFYLTMAVGQQAVQRLQDQLVLQPYFNPILLFKKISKDQPAIPRKDYHQYLVNKCGVTFQGSQLYLRKHSIDKEMSCHEYVNRQFRFIESILPYTPDILRNASSTIIWQVSAGTNLDSKITKLFKEIMKLESYYLLKMSTYRREIKLSWRDIRELIEDDLANMGPILERRTADQQVFNMMSLRRWLELYIRVDEKQIMDMMRWMHGGEQSDISKYFNNVYLNEGLCTCSWSRKHSSSQLSSFKSVKSKNRSKDSRKSSRGPLSINSFRSKASDDGRDEYGIPIEGKNKRNKHIAQNGANDSKNKSNSRNKFLKQISRSKPKPQGQNKAKSMSKVQQVQSVVSTVGQSEQAIEIWCEYVHTILESERWMGKHRQRLIGLQKQVEAVLREDVMSKKKNVTPMKKLISFIDKHLPLRTSTIKNMEAQLEDLAMENSVIFTIFQPRNNKQPKQDRENNDSGTQILLVKQIANVLSHYCQAKSKLIQLSKIGLKKNIYKKIFEILDSEGHRYITSQGLAEIMEQMGIPFTEQEIGILMRHFGDGKLLTDISFARAFQIQGS